jgi:anti-sigma B factor antagonist
MGLQIATELAEGCVVVRPSGELDIATAGHLREVVIDAIGAGHHDIVVDLSAVTFIDSSGLGVLVGAMKRCVHAGGRLMLTGVDAPGVDAAYRASGLGRVVQSSRTADRALASFRG